MLNYQYHLTIIHCQNSAM